MSNLVLPESVRIKVLSWAGLVSAPRDSALASHSIAFSVDTFARAKNDYHLGPFFSRNGVLTITRFELERAAAVELEFGLMDYRSLSECYPLIEIRAWSAADIERAIARRQPELKRGRFFSDRETEWWGSPAEYVQRLETSGNRNLDDPVWFRIRDEWDGTKGECEYEYRLPQSATA